MAQVKTALRDVAVDGFVAHEDIEPTSEWVTEIETALETCDALATFLTPTFHETHLTRMALVNSQSASLSFKSTNIAAHHPLTNPSPPRGPAQSVPVT